MDSLHSKVSFYTALSVLVVFVTTILYICWKLTFGRGKANELPHSSPRNPTLPEQPLLVDTGTCPHEPLESVLEQFIEERKRNLESAFHERQRKIDSARQQQEVKQVHRYLDSIALDSTSPGLSQSPSLSQQSLYITSDHASDPVYNTISSRSVSEQSIRGEENKTTLGRTSIVSNSFFGTIPKIKAFKTIKEYEY